MKTIKLSSFLIILITFFGCYDVDEIHENPNNIEEAHPGNVLTTVLHNTFEVQGRGPLFASRMLILTSEENSEQYYKWDRNEFDDYAQLENISKMMEEADRINEPVYKGIGLFLKSYYFYRLTLTFGDIPYLEALQGENEVYSPTYNTQKEVFEGILADLETSNNILKENSGASIGGDIIYNGSSNAWLKLINSFRLKVLLTLSNKEDELNIASQFNNIYSNEMLISSNEESGQLEFKNEAGARYTEFNSSSYGSSTYMGESFVNLMKQYNDPRLFAIAERTPNAQSEGLDVDNFDGYNGGIEIGNYNDAEELATQGKLSKVDPRYYENPTAEAHGILTYGELELILAEASVRGWISADASSHYNQAIRANFDFYSKYAPNYAPYLDEASYNDYISQDIVRLEGDTDQKIEKIINQKYLMSFLQNGWNIYFEHLRTGYPEWSIADGSPSPYRWMYPISEYNQNAANVTEAIARQFGGNDDIYEKTWWLK